MIRNPFIFLIIISHDDMTKSVKCFTRACVPMAVGLVDRWSNIQATLSSTPSHMNELDTGQSYCKGLAKQG